MTVLSGVLNDSFALVFNEAGTKYGFWKLGGKPKLVSQLNVPIDFGIDINKEVRIWRNEDLLIYNYFSSIQKHWVLNSEKGDIKKFSFTGEDAWLESCIDFKYHKGEVFCVKMDSTDSSNLNLWVDGTVTDSLYLNGCKIWETYGWHGPYLIMRLFCLHFHSPNVKEVAWWYGMFDVRKVDYTNRRFDTTFTDLWYSIERDFAQSQNNFITFYPEDLIVTGGE